MDETPKRAASDGDGTNYSSPNDRHNKVSLTSNLAIKNYQKTPPIDEAQIHSSAPLPFSNNDDDTTLIGKILLESFTQANIWYTPSPDDKIIMIIESPSMIPAPLTLVDTNNKPRWDIIKAIPKTDLLLLEDMFPTDPHRKKLDLEIDRHLVRINLPKTGFIPQLSAWFLANLKTTRNKKCLPVFSLANRFARTPPSSLPGFEDIDASYILPITPLVEFWISAVQVFGAVYLPANITKTIYSKKNPPAPITPLGKIYSKHDRDNPATHPVTSEDDLHSDDGTGLHDILSEQTSKAMLKSNITWRATYTNLARLTEKSTAVWHLLNTGIRLAKTQPIQIPGWIDEDLASSLIADAWVGAQETFGALWTPPPGVTFSPQVAEPAPGKKTPTKACPRLFLYITRTKKAPKVKKPPKTTYSTVTFLHLSLPIAVQGVKGFADAETELFAAVHGIWEAFLSVEPHKTHILPWFEPGQVMGG
jgi:hypothetical protein